MLQIEEGKHVYHIYTFVTLDVSNDNILTLGHALDTTGVILCLD